ncbi:MAG: DUF933 domain-containing protein [Candidatus Omnitrophica bacterium]|nr:DUF933 domain-containing protein [Candidatus Omnitrophota bacterium]
MKIAILGLNFILGKNNLKDERLEKLALILHSPKVISIAVELKDASSLKDADAIIAREDLKLDLILMDLERLQTMDLREDISSDLLRRLKDSLEKEILLNEVSFNPEEEKIIQSLNLVSFKPIGFMKSEDDKLLIEKIKELYYRSKRICFFTTNERELRAWEIKKGTTAYQASGLIHSDIQRGFIKAEVIGYDSIIQAGGLAQAKGKGLMRLEDRDYAIQDGDLIYFRFNV